MRVNNVLTKWCKIAKFVKAKAEEPKTKAAYASAKVEIFATAQMIYGSIQLVTHKKIITANNSATIFASR